MSQGAEFACSRLKANWCWKNPNGTPRAIEATSAPEVPYGKLIVTATVRARGLTT